MTSAVSKRLVTSRRAAQTLSVMLLLFIIWNTRYPLEGFISPEFLFMIDPLAMAVTSIAERVLLTGLMLAAAHLALSFVLGRFFCGWICPLGALMDAVAAVMALVMRPFGRREREKGPGRLRLGKYLVLAALLVIALFGVQLAWLFDPITIFVRAVSFNLHPAVNAAIDGGLARLITASGYPEWLESIYDALHGTVISTSLPRFPHTGVTLAVFAAILAAPLFRRRLWCRWFCPLGAFLALPALRPLLRRDASACTANCGACRDVCRMGAIRGDNTYAADECVLCMDCVARCPRASASTFAFKRKAAPVRGSLSRARFIALAAGSLSAFAASPLLAAAGKKPSRPGTAAGIRPPGALPGDEFIQRCIRCGNCMKVCPTNLLQPAPFLGNAEGAWSPVMDFRRGYCEFGCNLCGRVCPTDAIREMPLRTKQAHQVGVAIFDPAVCIPFVKGENCIVCEEHCPVPDKAIKIKEVTVRGVRIKRPYVIPSLCIGCGICEHKCPTDPEKGIVVAAVRMA